MTGSDVRYFVTGNTSRGQVDFLASNLGRLSHTALLENYPEELVSGVVCALGRRLQADGQQAEYLMDSLSGAPAGLIAPGLDAGFFNLPFGMKISGAWPAEGIVMPDAWKRLVPEAEELARQIERDLAEAGEHFAGGLAIHDEWETHYIGALDFQKMNDMTAALIQDLLGEGALQKSGASWDRFLGGATADGSVDHIDALTAGLSRRIFIKGRPGTGKSTMLKKLAKSAVEKGFDTEIYHCGFDPDSLDMVILRELSVCVFDSTAPHEYFPEREGDEILDVYRGAAIRDVDLLDAAALEDIQTRYQAKIQAARACLQRVKAGRDAMGRLVEAAADESGVQKVKVALERLFWQ